MPKAIERLLFYYTAVRNVLIIVLLYGTVINTVIGTKTLCAYTYIAIVTLDSE